MDKLILIEGTNNNLIEEEINNILKKLTNYEYIKYDLNNVFIDNVIEDLDTYNMFLKQKAIVCTNPLFLNEKIENFPEKKFLKYVNNPSDNILILVTNKLNKRLKLVTTIKNNFKIIQIKEINIHTYLKKYLDNYEMDTQTINYFINKVGTNLDNLKQELNKLKSYKLIDKVITKQDIDFICNKNIESSIFELIEAIINKDKIKSYELYNHFLNNGTEIFQIMTLLANQIRLIYNVKALNNLNNLEISKLLEVHEYPVKLAREKSYKYTKQELLNIIYELAKMDEDIKNGLCLPNISFLAFIMQM